MRAGDLETGVAGGMESMSSAPYLLPNARFGYRMGDAKALDSMVHDGLQNPFSGKHMMQEASEVASELELTRPDMDKWALRSHELAVKATDEGRLPEEILPVTVKSKKGDCVVEIDEAPRRETSLEALAKLPPQFVRTARTRPATRPASTTAPARSCSPPTSGPSRRAARRWRGSSRTAEVADDFPYLARTPGQRLPARRSRRPG